MTEEEKQLDLLAIFHYVIGGFVGLLACIPLVHVVLGVVMVSGLMDGANGSPALAGWIFIFIGGLFILMGWTLASAILVAGRKLQKRKSRTYCLVIASLECLMTPFGTILGVFTIILLMKDSTKALFAGEVSAPVPPQAPPPIPPQP